MRTGKDAQDGKKPLIQELDSSDAVSTSASTSSKATVAAASTVQQKPFDFETAERTELRGQFIQ